MNQPIPGPSLQMPPPPSPRQQQYSPTPPIPSSSPYQSQPPPPPLYTNGPSPYPMPMSPSPVMGPYGYPYPPPHPQYMPGPSNGMMPPYMPVNPYYPPPPQQYMYPYGPPPPQQQYQQQPPPPGPSSPSPRYDARPSSSSSEYPHHPHHPHPHHSHRGGRGSSRNNFSSSSSSRGFNPNPNANGFRPRQQQKPSSYSTTNNSHSSSNSNGPSSPFPLQLQTQTNQSQSQPIPLTVAEPPMPAPGGGPEGWYQPYPPPAGPAYNMYQPPPLPPAHLGHVQTPGSEGFVAAPDLSEQISLEAGAVDASEAGEGEPSASATDASIEPTVSAMAHEPVEEGASSSNAVEQPSSLDVDVPAILAEAQALAEAKSSSALASASASTSVHDSTTETSQTAQPQPRQLDEDGFAIVHSRPADPALAVAGVMFSVFARPSEFVLQSARRVDGEDVDGEGEKEREMRGKKKEKARIVAGTRRRRGTRIPRETASTSEPAVEYVVVVPSSPLPSSIVVELPAPETSTSTLAPPTEKPSASAVVSLPPSTPTLSSSQASTPATPTTATTDHTPSPSSPISSATSVSGAQPSPAVAKALANASANGASSGVGAGVTVASTSKPAAAPKSWAGLFSKPAPASAPKAPTASSSAAGPATAVSDAGEPADAVPKPSTSTTAPSSSSPAPAPVAQPPSSPITSTSTHKSSPSQSLTLTTSPTPPLHTLLTALPSLSTPAPLINPRGLVNTGNMCFANVTMQALLYTAPFYRLVDYLGRALTRELGKRGILDAVISFMNEFPIEGSAAAALPSSEWPSAASAAASGSGSGKASGSGSSKPVPSSSSTPLTAEQLRQQAWEKDSFIPQGLYNAMLGYKRLEKLGSGGQEDAEEFLGVLLETLHDELLAALGRVQANPPPSSAAWAAANPLDTISQPPEETPSDGWLEVGKKNKVTQTRVMKARDTAISKMFGGSFRDTLHTPGSGTDSAKVEPFLRLPLDIDHDHIRTIEDALKHMTQPETVQIVTSGNRHVDASKQRLIESLHPILIVHVKRFDYNRATGEVEKSFKPILYQTTLEISNDLIAAPSRTPHNPRYRLYGVVYHHGKYAGGGHYTIDLLRQNQTEWIRIDDTHIEVIPESRVALTSPDAIPPSSDMDKTAYLLFYQRLPDPAPAPSSPQQLRRPAAASQKGKSPRA